MPFLAYPNPIYQPAMRIISNITNASSAIVTTTFDHLYKSGTIVRLDIPLGYGMEQIDQQFGPITVLSPTTFSIPIDSTEFDAYIASPPLPLSDQYPQVVPFAENNDQLTAAVINTLNPNVPGGL